MKVLACVDLTEGDAAVLATLRRWRRDTALEVIVQHVLPDEPAFMGLDEPGGPLDRTRQSEDMARKAVLLDRLVRELGASGIAGRGVLARGEVVDEILGEAGREGVDLILLGARHRSRLQRLLGGSTLRTLLGRASVAVAIAQHPELEE